MVVDGGGHPPGKEGAERDEKFTRLANFRDLLHLCCELFFMCSGDAP